MPLYGHPLIPDTSLPSVASKRVYVTKKRVLIG